MGGSDHVHTHAWMAGIAQTAPGRTAAGGPLHTRLQAGSFCKLIRRDTCTTHSMHLEILALPAVGGALLLILAEDTELGAQVVVVAAVLAALPLLPHHQVRAVPPQPARTARSYLAVCKMRAAPLVSSNLVSNTCNLALNAVVEMAEHEENIARDERCAVVAPEYPGEAGHE